MVDVLRCHYNKCNKLYINPVKLPCKRNVCKTHVDDYVKLTNSNSFRCHYCKSDHEIPKNGFPTNDELIKLLNWHLKKENDQNKQMYCCKHNNSTNDSSLSSMASSLSSSTSSSLSASPVAQLKDSSGEAGNNSETIDPDDYIYEYITNVRGKIDVGRERMIAKIQAISDEMVKKMKTLEMECKSNMKRLNDLIEQNKVLQIVLFGLEDLKKI